MSKVKVTAKMKKELLLMGYKVGDLIDEKHFASSKLITYTED